MRLGILEKFNLADDFELSQSYLFFWDKFEKCNYFLENVLLTANQRLDGRLVQHLLKEPISDGGEDVSCGGYDAYDGISQQLGMSFVARASPNPNLK
ncbi:unnamed protein product [Sphacelaria rigidula]